MRTPLLLSCLLSLACAATPAQDRICFSFDDYRLASGRGPSGQSEVTIVLHGARDEIVGIAVARPRTSDAPSAVRDELARQLTDSGLLVETSGSGVLCVRRSLDKSFQPLPSRICSGKLYDEDTGLKLNAHDNGVDLVFPHYSPPPFVARYKANGVLVPDYAAGVRATFSGASFYDFTIDRAGLPEHRFVSVPVGVGDDAVAVHQRTGAALRAVSLLANEVSWRVQAAQGQGTRRVSGFGIDRTADGWPVVHVLLRPHADPQMVDMALAAGDAVELGACDYGIGSVAAGAGREPFLRAEGKPCVGGAVNVVADFLVPQPGTAAGILLGPLPAALPLPMFGPEAMLLVEPQGALLLQVSPDPLGCARSSVAVPNLPALLGARQHWQAFTYGPAGLALTNGLMTALGQ